MFFVADGKEKLVITKFWESMDVMNSFLFPTKKILNSKSKNTYLLIDSFRRLSSGVGGP